VVRGLELFKEHFKDHADAFIIIGGTACSLLLEVAGEEFRSTKDIDIVLCVDNAKPGFSKAFRDFIEKGGYQNRQGSTDRKVFYRFDRPADKSYPDMLELFSTNREGFDLGQDARITPVPLGEEASSLSAILMDADYYSFVRDGVQFIDGLPVLKAEHLIPLKAKAFLDLSERKNRGEPVDSNDIKKHKNDVFRLYPLLTADMRPSIPGSVQKDMAKFLEMMGVEMIDFKALGLRADLLKVLDEMKKIYGV